MQIRTRVKDGATCVEVIDPSDGAIVRSEAVCEGEQFTVTATNAGSPADLQFSECEAIPEPEAEAAEVGSGDDEPGEASAGTPAEGDDTPLGMGDSPATAAEDDSAVDDTEEPA